jgi:cysteine desulfurase family protein (TIGR01976 family)
MMASTEEIRTHFPALERVHNEQPVAYFDAPGGTQVPLAVGNAVTDYLYHHNANTHWAYPTSEETDAVLLAARQAMADFLNCEASEVAFGANMTTLTFHVARALGRTWARGDEIIVSELDHHANVAPWRALEREFGVIVRTARMQRDTAQLDYEHLGNLVNLRTRLVAVGGASNAVGTINDLERVARIARGVTALFFVDAVHLAPHELIDVQRIGCDFLACSSYKFYGPHAGILFARGELLQSLPFPKLEPAPDEGPERAETGTQNHEGIAGIGAAVDFLASLSGHVGPRRERLASTYAALHERGYAQATRLWDALASMEHVTLYGPSPQSKRTPTIAFTIRDVDAEAFCRGAAAQGLFLSHGDFYAQTVIEKLGVPALIRAGCAMYTTGEEIERLIDYTASPR